MEHFALIKGQIQVRFKTSIFYEVQSSYSSLAISMGDCRGWVWMAAGLHRFVLHN
jgi:hypothetical protein